MVDFRTVWITGAGKGIGRAVALRFARDGATVAASARTTDDLKQLEADAQGLAGRIVGFPLDVTDEAAVGRVLGDIMQEMGLPELAILNAGTHAPTPAGKLDSATVRRLIDINLMGTVHCLTALLPGFIARGSGRIAVVASVAGYSGLPSAAAYGATKAGLINMCEALKPELDRHGVALSLINPGFVRTPLTDRNDFPMPFLMEADAAAERIVAGLRRGRFEIAFPSCFVFLLKLLRCLPYGLFFRITRRLVRE